MEKQHVVVIGAGIIGVCTALQLLQDGHQVTLLDPEQPGGAHAASYGNGAWISPASIIPMSMPGLWKKVPGFLLNPLGPLTIRWKALPALAPWLIRFIMAGATIKRAEKTVALLAQLLDQATARHLRIAEQAGLTGWIKTSGLLYVYPDQDAFKKEALVWRLRKQHGVEWDELNQPALQQIEPKLSKQYQFGALVLGAAYCIEPGAYVAALAKHFMQRGGRLINAKATGFDIQGHRLRQVFIEGGAIDCNKAVIANGISAPSLVKAAGDRVPLISERGYHIQLTDPAVTIQHPIMPSDGKMGITITRAGLRSAGQVELAGLTDAPDWRRAKILEKHLANTLPATAQSLSQNKPRVWMGHRPSTPDGLPVIGQSTHNEDVIYAFGHGHVGLASAPATALMVAAIIAKRETSIPLAPFAAKRFQ